MPHGYWASAYWNQVSAQLWESAMSASGLPWMTSQDKWKYPCRKQPWNLSSEGELTTQCGIAFPSGLLGDSKRHVYSVNCEKLTICVFQCMAKMSKFLEFSPQTSKALLLYWRFLWSLRPFLRGISVLLGSSLCWSSEYKVKGLVSSFYKYFLLHILSKIFFCLSVLVPIY